MKSTFVRSVVCISLLTSLNVFAMGNPGGAVTPKFTAAQTVERCEAASTDSTQAMSELKAQVASLQEQIAAISAATQAMPTSD